MNGRWWLMLVFLAIVTAVLGGVHWLMWARFVRDPGWGPTATRTLTMALITLAVLMPLTMMGSRLLPRTVMRPFSWVVFVWMGATLYLFLGAIGISVVRGLSIGTGLLDPSRREAFSRGLALVTGGVATALSVYGIRRGLSAWHIKTVRVPLARLGAGMEGLKIVQLTDIHVGSASIERGFIESMVREVNALDPDIIAITGDLVDGSVAALGPYTAPLAGLRAKHGVYFVTGNHEYYSGAEDWMRELTRLGIRVLRNEHVTLTQDGATLDLAGVFDLSARRMEGETHPDMEAALRGHDTQHPVVLLAHQPKHALEAIERGVDLVLSGHTHGGQLWPFSYLVKLDQTFLAGLHTRGATHVYVSEGTGYWGPPMRVGTAPEITRLVLTRA